VFLAVFSLICACSDSIPDSEKRSLETDQRYSSFANLIQSPNFEVFEIADEDGAVRISLTLVPSPSSAADIRRETINALLEIKSRLDDKKRLSVWSYETDHQTVQGMAYYSPVTEQYHYKSAGELN
jgi:hypothetical protein